MEHSRGVTHDQYGNGDYAQLDGWSGQTTYKTTANDSGGLIYTSDYGSYSSQESNHSGTTYSNLADCEEALHSPPTIVYDLPPPQLSSTMEKRRDKPLPPPRMTSKVQVVNKTRFLESTKAKKISFDDSSLCRGVDSKSKPEDAVPSFATLPRKKKLANNSNSSSTPSAPQVTWMKEVAQKGESIDRSKSANSVGNKKPQGILKNKIDDQQKKGDTTGYIKRNTVQKILEQQRSAKSRQPGTPAPNQCYKSMPSLAQTPEAIIAQHKAWEYNFNNSSNITTAQVIGVFEPSQDGDSYIQHTKQNSAETEFEFPPPPSDQDMTQLMMPGNSAVAPAAQRNDFTPLNLACIRNDKLTSNIAPVAVDRNVRSMDSIKKPPVPQKPKSLTTNSTETTASQRPNTNSLRRGLNNERTTPTQPKRHSVHNTKQPSLQLNTNQRVESHQPVNSSLDQLPNDIVLPPPEFQEGNTCSMLANQQPSYGDYELLSQDSSVHTTALPQSHPYPTATDHLVTRIQDNFNVHTSSKPTSQYGARYGYQPHYPNNMYSGHNHINPRFTGRHYQYSTEL